MAIYVKINGTWEGGSPTVNLCYHKSSGTWFQASDPKMYLKENKKYNFIDVRSTAVTVTILGGYQEVITFTDSHGTTYTVTCDDDGNGGTLELDIGTYTLTSSYLTQTQINRTVIITDNTSEVTSYPPGAIYWYGIFCFGASYSTALGSRDYANRSVDLYDSDIRCYAQARAYPKSTYHETYAAINFTNIDRSNYSTVNFYVNTASNGTKGIGMSSSAGGNKSVTVTSAGIWPAQITSDTYLGAKCYRRSTSGTSFVSATLRFSAVWMT